MRFAERYFGIFHAVLEATKKGGKAQSPGKLRELITRLMQEEENQPLPQGYSQADRREALWPVLVWADERLMTYPKDNPAWHAHSLQREFLDTNQGGSLFFLRLEDLLARREGGLPTRRTDDPLPIGPELNAESFDGEGTLEAAADEAVEKWRDPGQGPEPLEGILDVFALCLLMGFQGRYSQGKTLPPSKVPRMDPPQPVLWKEPVAMPLGGPIGDPEGEPGHPQDDPAGKAADDFGYQLTVGVPYRLTGSLVRGLSDGQLQDEEGRRALAELRRLSQEQLAAWRERDLAPPPVKKRKTLLQRLIDFFWEYDWVLLYIVIPIAILGFLYLRSLRIIQNLPF
ncbi:MAG: DotU family type IV/VI secretion system protein [Deltaproteobacteria bacterium]|jgi:hypothetical protein|nr:DotU family type IV/VI secretion system protein [Deltaproteobacteria bacterium]